MVAASAGSETEAIEIETSAFQQGSTDEIANFFENIRNRQGIFDNKGQPASPAGDNAPVKQSLPVEAVVQRYHLDYKPLVSVNKKYVYSINEMVSISRQLPAGYADGIVAYLPKRKFWRLSHKQPDHGSQGKSVSHRGSNKGLNGSANGKNLSGDDNNGFEKKGNKGKYARTPNGKKAGKFGKHDRGSYMEEKDISVNNDDLQALEEEFQPTGNSMADFESWKAKMKEMERRKKGLPPLDQTASSKPSLTKTSSSISDFLGLNRVNNDSVTNGVTELQETYKKSADDDNAFYKEGKVESAKGSYSRFSSFFAQSSSSSSLPIEKSPNTESEPLAKQNHGTANASAPNPQNSHVPGGSRLLSFFKNEANTPRESQSQHSLNNQEMRQSPTDPPIASSHSPLGSRTTRGFHVSHDSNGSHRQHDLPQQEQHPISQPSLPSHQMRAPDQLQTNNAFFQGLLNKGELHNNDRNPPGPPPGVMLPPAGQRRFPMGQQPSPPQGGHSISMGMSRAFPMGMPPGAGGFPAPQPPAGIQPNGAPTVGQSRGSRSMNKNSNNASRRNTPSANSNGAPTEGTGPHRSQPPPPSFQPGMVPPPFIPNMAPPGFPMMPPNFNPMYMPPQGGLMPPPAGQGFFPPMPPPAGSMNFNAFPMQPPPPNKHETKVSEIKK